LKRHAALRSDPRNLLPSARTVIVVGARYPARNPPPAPPGRGSDDLECKISNYARGLDYHVVLNEKLAQLAFALEEKHGQPIKSRICVDSAPLPEREWAVRAGIGWIGKQGSVVSPEIGCCFFLGELLVDIDLEPGAPMANQCQDCRRCVEACPAKAIMAGNLVDARRCVSYLTVEHKGEINPDIASCFGGSVFGCDRCTSVCPWNQRAEKPVMPEFDIPPSAVPSLEVLGRLDRHGFKKMFANTPVERTGFERFQRNVKIALANQ